MDEPAWAPDILFGYLPLLDYDLQRHGPRSQPAAAAWQALDELLGALVERAARAGYDVLLAGEYAVGPVHGEAVLLNRHLREAGLFQVRKIGRRTYPDFFGSSAFAVVDHEIAHVYVRDPQRRPEVRFTLEAVDGVAQILDRPDQAARHVDHPAAGDFLLVAVEGRWFAYPWWTDPREEPDFAGHVDIHNKPGFDPCELFAGRLPIRVSRDTSRVRGSHGAARPDRGVAWGATFDLPGSPATFLELARALRDYLNAV